MFARVNRFKENTDIDDEAERIAEDEVVRQLQGIQGFLGVLSLVDRDSAQSLAITFWDTQEARFEVALRVGL